MVSTCFYFQVHQPYRLARYSVFDIGSKRTYFNDERNRKEILKIVEKCYLPANKVMLELLDKHPEFKISYSFSGVVLDQFLHYAPEVIDSFKELVNTGRVELLDETYYHSLSFLFSLDEFKEQIRMHNRKIRQLFRVSPTVFRNTELVYNNELASVVESLGYKAVLAEGADHVLGWRSPNFVYKPKGSGIRLLLKNYRLSDDIAFRFSDRTWSQWPLNAPKFAQWVAAVNGNGNLVNLFMDYETFGEHQWADTGIFEFMRSLPEEILKHPDNDFMLPSEAAELEPISELDVPFVVSWADIERDVSAWLGNRMQQAAANRVFGMSKEILASGDEKLINDWRMLQISDHLYYMCTKWFNDGDVHKYFNPYETPYDAFISYMNILNDISLRLKERSILA